MSRPAPLRFEVPGPPKGKGRPRFSARTGRAYTPAATRTYERAIRLAAIRAVDGRACDGPWPVDKETRYRVDVIGYFANQVRCDGDNLLKAICDAMNGIVYPDDRQVDIQSVARRTDPILPRVEVSVEVLP